jgi:hypothetical protein
MAYSLMQFPEILAHSISPFSFIVPWHYLSSSPSCPSPLGLPPQDGCCASWGCVSSCTCSRSSASVVGGSDWQAPPLLLGDATTVWLAGRPAGKGRDRSRKAEGLEVDPAVRQ